MPETAVTALAPVLCMARTERYVRARWVPGVGIPGGYQGWVYRGSTPSHAARGGPASQRPQGAGPPPRGRVGWKQGPGDTGTAAGRLLDHPAGPVRPPCGPPCPGPLECRLLANKARFQANLLKVSQNRGVSPKVVEKACHSPYIQNGPQNSPLGILRFPFSPAFSHKELMGAF